ncbi:MAG TPA: 1-phosphofructokinase family hexose kinase [Tepidisphaeraceae bacterium]|nr:1-phosphofructokinase family hexose kinase [Tepidisphaeraceae bacterium]
MLICLGTTPAVQRIMTFAQLHVNGVNRAREAGQSASGKSLNVARVAHTLGEPVIATGFIGGDTGWFIRKDLDAAGIRHDFVEIEPPTRTCVTVIDQSAGTATELIEESKPVEPRAWDHLREKLESLLPIASVLVLSGTLTPGAPQDFYAQCIRLATAHRVRTIVDATGEPLRHALAAKPYLVKPNRGEIGKTLDINTSHDEGTREAMKRMIAEGAEWVVVTMGTDGVMFSDGKAFWRVSVPRVEVVSPIGSGDAFAAGLAVGLSRGQSVNEAVTLATACGAANAMTPAPGFARPADVERLQRSVVVATLPS